MKGTKTKALLGFRPVRTFGILLIGGYRIDKGEPPIPKQVVLDSKNNLFTDQDILDGQKRTESFL